MNTTRRRRWSRRRRRSWSRRRRRRRKRRVKRKWSEPVLRSDACCAPASGRGWIKQFDEYTGRYSPAPRPGAAAGGAARPARARAETLFFHWFYKVS